LAEYFGILEYEIGDIEANLGYCNGEVVGICNWNLSLLNLHVKVIVMAEFFAIGDIEFFALYFYSFNYAFQLSKQTSMAEVVGMYASFFI